VRTIFVLATIGLGVLIAFANHFFAMLFYWWLAIFRPQDWIYIDVSSLRLSEVAASLLIAGSLVRGKLPRVSGPIAYLMLLLLALEALATSTVGCGWQGSHWLGSLTRMFLLLYFTDRLLETPRHVLLLMAVIGLSLGFYAAKAGFGSVLGGGTNQYGLSNLEGSFSGSNAFALGTAIIFFYILAFGLNVKVILGKTALTGSGEPKWWLGHLRWAMFVVCFFSAFNIISLSSRGSVIALTIGLLVFNGTRPNATRRLLKAIPVALILLLIVPLPEGFSERISSVFASAEDRDASAAGRPDLWFTAVRMINVHPTGVGTRCYAAHFSRFDTSDGRHGRARSVHSSHFQILAETGYAGAITWLGLFFFSSLAILKIRKRARDSALALEQRHTLESTATCLGCSIVVFAVGGSFYELAHIEPIWISFLLCGSLDRISKGMVRDAHASGGGASPPDSATAPNTLGVPSRRRKSIYDHPIREVPDPPTGDERGSIS
jgi:putative inorganic carbon (hco3(-)) transporter